MINSSLFIASIVSWTANPRQLLLLMLPVITGTKSSKHSSKHSVYSIACGIQHRQRSRKPARKTVRMTDAWQRGEICGRKCDLYYVYFFGKNQENTIAVCKCRTCCDMSELSNSCFSTSADKLSTFDKIGRARSQSRK
jgi:hypothetical protein